MRIMTLYRYIRPDGGVTVSPNQPDSDYTNLYRLIADEGKILTHNGEDFVYCIDVMSQEGWFEIDDPNPIDEELLESEEN